MLNLVKAQLLILGDEKRSLDSSIVTPFVADSYFGLISYFGVRMITTTPGLSASPGTANWISATSL